MKAPSQIKVSTISFLIALIVSLAIFGVVAYLLISSFMAPDEPEKTLENEQTENVDKEGPVVLDPEEIEAINGNSFTVLIAGYDLQGIGFDAMAVLDINKETQKATVYPINVDTKVYVGHGDSNSLNVRTGDLIKFKDMQYVLDKVNATTGLKIEYYVTFTAQGFIEAFDAFNSEEAYTYKVPKSMEHTYIEIPEKFVGMVKLGISKEDDAKADDLAAKAQLTEEEREELAVINEFARYNFSFKKGDSISEGIDIYNMLRYKGDSASDRINRQATFIRDIITKIIPERFKEDSLSAVIDTAKALIKLEECITTNINVETFITETFELIAAVPEFSMGTVTKYTSGIANFK